jgi:phage shock protein A
MSKLEQSFASKITRINTMIAAIKAADQIITHHLPEGFVDEMVKRHQQLMQSDAEHEALKSKVKEMTVDIDKQLYELESRFRYAKNIVKLELPQESWLTYGCNAKR